MLPVVAIVGRPNVGKSTLFNRLIGKRYAIVDDQPGITRDRLYEQVVWSGQKFQLIDTGGIMVKAELFQAEIQIQAQIAIEEAQVILFVIDGRDELSVDDLKVAQLLRKSAKPVIVAANKLENSEHLNLQIYQLGFEIFNISAIHGIGIGDLLDRVLNLLPPQPQSDETNDCKISIVGRPNVGKSSLLNLLTSTTRAIVSEIPGTTRDMLEARAEILGTIFTFVDTAGIKRKSKLLESVEHYALNRSFQAIDLANLVILMLDATHELSHFDSVIGGYVAEARKPIIIVINKWDLIQKTTNTMQEFSKRLYKSFKFLDYAPLVFISIKEQARILTLKEAIIKVKLNMEKRIKTSVLNDFIAEAQIMQPSPTIHGARLQIYFVKQVKAATPCFTLFVNDIRHLHFSYERYLENQFRKVFDFSGVPIQLLFRNKKGGQDE